MCEIHTPEVTVCMRVCGLAVKAARHGRLGFLVAIPVGIGAD